LTPFRETTVFHFTTLLPSADSILFARSITNTIGVASARRIAKMINEQVLERVRDRMAYHDKKRNGKLSFTVELGRGETYANDELTVYAHDNYPRSSVLYGRERRMWIASFGGGSEIDAKDTIKAAGAARITQFCCSTHVPVEQVVSHLPGDEY
jgi:hypothetical protein